MYHLFLFCFFFWILGDNYGYFSRLIIIIKPAAPLTRPAGTQRQLRSCITRQYERRGEKRKREGGSNAEGKAQLSVRGNPNICSEVTQSAQYVYMRCWGEARLLLLLLLLAPQTKINKGSVWWLPLQCWISLVIYTIWSRVFCSNNFTSYAAFLLSSEVRTRSWESSFFPRFTVFPL